MGPTLAMARGIVELRGGDIWAQAPLYAMLYVYAWIAALLPACAPSCAGTADACCLPLTNPANAPIMVGATEGQ